MAKDAVPPPKKRNKPTREVSLAAVMLHARAIIEQGRTAEFLEACKNAEYAMRATPEFLKFARSFALADSHTEAFSATKKFSSAVKKKSCDDITTSG